MMPHYTFTCTGRQLIAILAVDFACGFLWAFVLFVAR